MQQNIELIVLDTNNPDHLELMFRVRTHPEVDRYLTGKPPSNFHNHVHYLRNLAINKKFYLVQVDSSLCGYCQLTLFDDCIEIGMALHPNYCSKGIGSIVLPRFLASIQSEESKSLMLYVKKDNLRAIALYGKYGFKRIGDENAHGEYLMKKFDDPYFPTRR